MMWILEIFKNLIGRTASDKVLSDKTFNITKNSKYEGYRRGLASMVYKFFNKKCALVVDKSVSSHAVKSEIMSNQKLADELYKPITRKFEKQKLH